MACFNLCKQGAPAVEEEGHHGFTDTRMDSFGFLWQGRIEVFPLLALPFTLALKMVAPHFVRCDNMWQKHVLFLVVPLQMTQTCSYSVNRLSLHQLMQNTLHANFSELQAIFDNGMHGAMANADLNSNLFLCGSLVFRIWPSICTITSDIIARWVCLGYKSSCSDVHPSQNLFCHLCTLVRDIQCSPYTEDMRQRILHVPAP